jgi:hypothetical protein
LIYEVFQADDEERPKAVIEFGQFFRILKFVADKLSFQTIPLPPELTITAIPTSWPEY